MTDTNRPKPPANNIAELIAGCGIALMEVVRYLHSKGVVNIDEVVAWLESGATNAEIQFDAASMNGSLVASPARRLAYVLRSASVAPSGADREESIHA